MSEKIKPIDVDKIDELFQKQIPECIIDAVNKLIISHYSPTKKEATIKQDEIRDMVVTEEMSRNKIFKNNWLDIEDIYRNVGWIVEYEKPAYCETWDAYFVFKKPKNK